MTEPKAKARPQQLAKVSRRLLTALASRTAHTARRVHRFVRDFEPWGIFLTLLGVALALFTFLYELEDRQAERTIRAWRLVLDVPPGGSSRRETFEYLNLEFNGSVCGPPVRWAARLLTGNRRRGCIFPPKERESLAGIDAIAVSRFGILRRLLLSSPLIVVAHGVPFFTAHIHSRAMRAGTPKPLASVGPTVTRSSQTAARDLR